MKKVVLLVVCLGTLLFTQAQCVEITSILVDACVDINACPTCLEEENEMFTFTVGSNPIDITNLSVTWPNFPSFGYAFNGWCNDAAKTAALNATISNGCGYLLEPSNGTIPAGAKAIVLTSTDIHVPSNSFNGLTDTLYILYQCAGNTGSGGHFRNGGLTAPSTTRTLTLTVSGTNGCSDIVNYVPANLLGTSSQFGNDGDGVSFDAAGTPSYFNNGCNAPVTALLANFNITDVCQNYGPIDLTTLLSPSATAGGTWSGPNVTGTTYNPAGHLGLDSITYSVSNVACGGSTIDSTIVFMIDTPLNGQTTLVSCDSVFYNNTWFTNDTTLSDTTMGSGFLCDSITSVILMVTSEIVTSNNLGACDSVFYNNTWFTADTVIIDTILGGGGIIPVIDTILHTSFEDNEGWTGHGSGNWTETDNNGDTWTGNGIYANNGSTNSGNRKIGFNTTGDWFQLPPVDNPTLLHYYTRLSSSPSSTNALAIEYFDGTNWVLIQNDTLTSTTYQLITVNLSSISGLTNVDLRIFRSSDNRSSYVDDITIFGQTTTTTPATCDSIFITNINVSQPDTIILNETICAGSGYELPNGTTVTMGGTYTFTDSSSGCYSTTIVNLTEVGNSLNLGNDTAICGNINLTLNATGNYSAYLWDDNSTNPIRNISTAGTYFVEVTANGPSENLVVNGHFENGNMGFTSDYTYYAVGDSSGPNAAYGITNNSNDWLYYFANCNDHTPGNGGNMLVADGSTNNTDNVWCQAIPVNQNTNYTFSYWLQTVHNEIDLATLEVSINGTVLGSTVTPNTPCTWQQETYTWTAPNTVNTALICIRTTSTVAIGNDFAIDDIFFGTPCKFVDTITVSQLNAVTQTVNISACDSATFMGTTYFTNTTFNDTLIGGSNNGCDSITTVNITVNNTVTTNNPQTICAGNTYSINGNTYNTAGTYTDIVGTTTSGCDSIIETVLTVLNNDTTINTQVVCGESYLFNNNTYTTSGLYYDVVGTTSNGCDSIIETDLTLVNPITITDVSASNNPINSGESTTITIDALNNTGNFIWNPNVGTSNEETLTLTDTTTVSITVEGNMPCPDTTVSITINVITLDSVELQIPAAFTPNGDNLNDIFKVKNHTDFITITLNVYDRWGELVYSESDNDHNGWDGTYKINYMPADTYVYYIEAVSNSNKTIQHTGTVYLVH